MLETKHHYLPVFLAFYLPLSFVITYAIAVANDHVKPGFPYISDTGTFPPESCVFGQLLNIGAVLCGVIVYVRYRHVAHLHGNIPGRRVLINLNTASFVVGLVTNLGVSLVGNFQETSVIAVHLLGAFMAFFVGFIYCVLQTIISYKMAGFSENPGNTTNMRRFRIGLCIIDFIFLIVLLIAAGAANGKGPGKDIPIYRWTHEDPGYAEHLVSTISEWLIAVVSVVYFSTFYHEFKHFRVKAPTIVHYDSSVIKDDQPEMSVSTLPTPM